MKEKVESWKKEILLDKKNLIIALVFLLISSILYFLSGRYVSKIDAISTTDLILDNIPTVNLTFVYVWGFLAVIAVLVIYPLLFKPKMFSSVIGQFSLIILLRSIFITLTHLNPPTEQLLLKTPMLFMYLDFPNSLFFSGHTAIPFLGFLIYKKEKIGKFFLFMTVVLMTTVLLMHVHYSIDVFAALFITYGAYKIGENIFNKKRYKESNPDKD